MTPGRATFSSRTSPQAVSTCAPVRENAGSPIPKRRTRSRATSTLEPTLTKNSAALPQTTKALSYKHTAYLPWTTGSSLATPLSGAPATSIASSSLSYPTSAKAKKRKKVVVEITKTVSRVDEAPQSKRLRSQKDDHDAMKPQRDVLTDVSPGVSRERIYTESEVDSLLEGARLPPLPSCPCQMTSQPFQALRVPYPPKGLLE
jgi:hypothetical protein